ncbi:MAG: GtrA family protein [Mesorhizobium sp.]|nr:MAG: GtrA family protein [Mesorhizobium sp.]
MRVSLMPEHRFTAGVKFLARFGSVGIAATILYAVLAAVFARADRIGFTPVQASLAAYAAAALFSYLAHKSFSFMSAGPHRSEAPRFLLLSATGLGVAYAAPTLFTVMLGLPLFVPILLTCLVIPALNLIALDRWVFARRGADRRGDPS